MKVEEWLDYATTQLKAEKIDTSRLDALLLLENELDKPRTWIISHPEHPLPELVVKTLNEKLSQRLYHVPLAYIAGYKDFYGHTFMVTPDVLIPRPETEGIITLLKEIARNHDINTVIDIGTGSGILAIIAQLELPDVHVTASDVSKQALSVARRNGALHNVQVTFHTADLLVGLPKMPKTRPYVVLANLPYVPMGLKTSPEVTKEPAIALYSGNDGLKHYQRFWRQISDLKNKPLWIITESLEDQHQNMEELASVAGYRLQKTDTLVQLYYLA